MTDPTPGAQSDTIPGVPVTAKPLRVLLFVLTALSAAAALFLEPAIGGAVRRGALPRIWLFLPLGLYGLFFLAYAVDRWVLVQRRRYPAGKAFFQVAFGAVFALLLLPSTIGDWRAQRTEGTARLLNHPDVEVRIVAVEALGFRGASRPHVEDVVARLSDGDPRVRRAARRVLARWSGMDAEDLAGLESWAMGVIGTSTVSRREGAR